LFNGLDPGLVRVLQCLGQAFPVEVANVSPGCVINAGFSDGIYLYLSLTPASGDLFMSLGRFAAARERLLQILLLYRFAIAIAGYDDTYRYGL